ncbi:hypothetical protein BXZ70DRAFT_106835 [Cristinia sonorae]|uniref:DUF7330 domain-containing protein n=1 Tax=Cristinia sonorae TaxID=1940300 RepID=A0A8K0UQ92_9AGAR|nr:hypothetical protein BXZ70DRAFT_106835 [Cristinia sonorae]
MTSALRKISMKSNGSDRNYLPSRPRRLPNIQHANSVHVVEEFGVLVRDFVINPSLIVPTELRLPGDDSNLFLQANNGNVRAEVWVVDARSRCYHKLPFYSEAIAPGKVFITVNALASYFENRIVIHSLSGCIGSITVTASSDVALYLPANFVGPVNVVGGRGTKFSDGIKPLISTVLEVAGRQVYFMGSFPGKITEGEAWSGSTVTIKVQNCDDATATLYRSDEFQARSTECITQ